MESKVLPLVVAVAGRVASDAPISCEYTGLKGVIVEATAEQYFLKHNDAGSWIQDSALMLSMSKEVPWYLDDEYMLLGLDVPHCHWFCAGSEAFEESGKSLVRGTLDYLQGLKMLGEKRTERVLPTGTSLTVVGCAIPDLCVICLEQEYNAVFLPCGHMWCCTNCSALLTSCPLCRRRIDQTVKTSRH